MIIALAVILGGLVYGALRLFRTPTEDAAFSPNVQVPAETTDVVEEEKMPRVLIESRTAPPFPQNDRDNDGLTDEEEEALGTDSTQTDTDGDGLSDRREVQKWGTNPLSKDSDGDGFADAIEIMNGYNPLGEGTLQ